MILSLHFNELRNIVDNFVDTTNLLQSTRGVLQLVSWNKICVDVVVVVLFTLISMLVVNCGYSSEIPSFFWLQFFSYIVVVIVIFVLVVVVVFVIVIVVLIVIIILIIVAAREPLLLSVGDVLHGYQVSEVSCAMNQ